MSELNIGDNIAELRKARGITQEALGDIVGLTAQAVSKWESGGSPDTSLLPVIADYFGVSIDRLYGRKTHDYSNIQVGVREYISSIPVEDRFAQMFELMLSALHSCVDPPAVVDMDMAALAKIADEVRNMIDLGLFSLVFTENGLVKAGLNKSLPYALVMPEPEDGWGHRLHYKEAYGRLFSMLADDDILKALFYLTSRINKHFTPKLLEKEFGFSPQKASDILTDLATYDMLNTKELEVDNEIMTIYEFNPNPAFVPFLTFAEELITRPNAMYFHWLERENTPHITRKEQQI